MMFFIFLYVFCEPHGLTNAVVHGVWPHGLACYRVPDRVCVCVCVAGGEEGEHALADSGQRVELEDLLNLIGG